MKSTVSQLRARVREMIHSLQKGVSVETSETPLDPPLDGIGCGRMWLGGVGWVRLGRMGKTGQDKDKVGRGRMAEESSVGQGRMAVHYSVGWGRIR